MFTYKFEYNNIVNSGKFFLSELEEKKKSMKRVWKLQTLGWDSTDTDIICL